MIVIRDQFQGIDAKLSHIASLSEGAAATMGIKTIVVVIEEDGSISIVATHDGASVEVRRPDRRYRWSRLWSRRMTCAGSADAARH